MEVLYTRGSSEVTDVLCPASLLAKELETTGIGVELETPCLQGSPLTHSLTRLRNTRSPKNYDIFHAHSLEHPTLTSCCKQAKAHQRPFMVSLHEAIDTTRASRLSFIQKMRYNRQVRKKVEAADCVHVTSELELRRFRQMGYTNPVCLIPQPIEIKQFPVTHTDKTFRIGFYGKLHPEKHIERIFYSIQTLLRIIPPTPTRRAIEMVIIGEADGAYALTLHNEVKRLGIASYITFKGDLQGDEKDQVLSTCSVVIMPNAHENSSRRLLEALVRNIPCIGTKGSPSHNLDINCCGWTIEPTQDSLNRAIYEAYHTPNSFLQVMGENGRTLVEREYSIHAVAKQLKSVYNWLLGGDEPLGVIW